MRPSLLYRITRASASWRRPSGLMEQIRSRWHWGLLIPTLAIMTVVSVSIINLTGCASSSYSTSYATSSSTLCQSCHGTGEVAYVAEEKIITEEEQCVLPLTEQRDRHKDLLNDWKRSVVREGDSIYVVSDGQEYNMSLTGTCLDCHSNQAEFCVQCHSYAAVKPDCWNCHNLPEGDQ